MTDAPSGPGRDDDPDVMDDEAIDRRLTEGEILTDGAAGNQAVPSMADADETDQTDAGLRDLSATDPSEPGWVPGNESGTDHT
jgi:hypothetical protein